MKTYGNGSGEDLLEGIGINQVLLVKQGVAQAIRELNFGRKNKIREENLEANAPLKSKIGRRQLNRIDLIALTAVSRQIHRIFYTRQYQQTRIVIQSRLITHLQRQLNHHRFGTFCNGTTAIKPRKFKRSTRKTQSRQQPEVKILPQFQVTHNTQIKPRTTRRRYTADTIVKGKIFAPSNVKTRVIIPQRNTKIIRFMLKF